MRTMCWKTTVKHHRVNGIFFVFKVDTKTESSSVSSSSEIIVDTFLEREIAPHRDDDTLY